MKKFIKVSKVFSRCFKSKISSITKNTSSNFHVIIVAGVWEGMNDASSAIAGTYHLLTFKTKNKDGR